MNIQQTVLLSQGKERMKEIVTNVAFLINIVEVLIELFQLYTGLEMEKKHSAVQPKDYSNISYSFIVIYWP